MFGFFLSPTAYQTTSAKPCDFLTPVVHLKTTNTECILGKLLPTLILLTILLGAVLKSYQPVTFVAEHSVYIIDTGNAYSTPNFDAAAFLYSGNHTKPPENCTDLIVAGDTRDDGSLSAELIVGEVYTVFVSSYLVQNGTCKLYIATGRLFKSLLIG
jgi:hypothetical protein